MGAEGRWVEIPEYEPPVNDIFVYTALDGTKTIVDKYGTRVKYPPPVWNDLAGESTITMGPWGEEIKLQEYKPISSHWKK